MTESLSPPAAGAVILRSTGNGGMCWRCFFSPYETLRATSLAEIPDLLRRIDEVTGQGKFAAGFISYEAAPAFDAALRTKSSTEIPLAWFGLYDEEFMLPTLPPPSQTADPRWEADIDERNYHDAIARIKAYIAAGDTYQVNFTYRLRAHFDGDPWGVFLHKMARNPAPFAAYLDIESHAVCSASPELFFRREGCAVECRPMKGTAARGLTAEADERMAEWLAGSEKNRAENLMIVDMMRNDLGRIAKIGSVRVPSMFEIERHPTLWQMTSTVAARTYAPTSKVIAALFPCASVTGAPKPRTMEIIAELERSPRGVYTGAIGYCAPGNRAQFNVAIRTAVFDRNRGEAEYGVGGGIVWDSHPARERDECRTKSLALTRDEPDYSLLETMRCENGEVWLLERHLWRLAASARYFDYPMDEDDIRRRIVATTSDLSDAPHRLRLLLSASGEVTLERYPLETSEGEWVVKLARNSVSSADRFLYHKTTHRAIYEAARADMPGYDDVLLWNERGEVTESAIANLVARFGEDWRTPPVSCGLLAGTYREELLSQGRIREAVITLEELPQADELYFINSVRGWVRVMLSPISA